MNSCVGPKTPLVISRLQYSFLPPFYTHLFSLLRHFHHSPPPDCHRHLRSAFLKPASNHSKEVSKIELDCKREERKNRRMQFFGATEINPSPPAVTAGGNNAHMIYMFNRNGVCLLYREWNRSLHTLDANQDQKLMFGLLFSLKSLTAKMDPTSVEKVNLGVPQLPGQGCSFHSFRTNTYKLNLMETPSGIKLILVTSPRTGDLRESLKYIYNLYVEYVVKNPLYTPGTPIKYELFNTTLDQYVRGLG